MLLRLLRNIKFDKKTIFYPLFFVALYAVGSIGLAAFSGLLISKTALGIAIGLLHIPIGMVRLLGFAKPASKYFENYFSHNSLFLWIAEVRRWFFNQAKNLPLSKLESYENGKILKRFMHDISELEKFGILGIIPQFSAFTSFLIISLLLLTFSVKLFILNAVLYLFIVLFIPWLTKNLNKKKQIDLDIKFEEQNQLNYEMFQGFLEMRFHQDLKNHFIKKFITLQDKINRLETKIELSLSFWALLSKVLLFSFLIFTFYQLIPLVFSYKVNGVFMVLVIISYLTYIDILDNIAASFHQIEKASASSKNIIESVTQTEKVIYEETKDFSLDQQVEFRGLNFQYPNTKTPLFKDLHLTFTAKEQCILYAPSGYGKSTLLKLILKYYSVENEKILIDGEDINKIKTKSIFNAVSYIAQETFLFSSNLRENLLIAKPEAQDKDLLEVLELVRLEHLLKSRQGLDTLVGELGNKLSGGEKQRLAIARAILKKASLLILDEATASLDWRNKQIFEEIISELLLNKQTIIRAEVSKENFSSNQKIIDLTKHLH